jgi:UDP-N-acetylmuramate--alanine ligase
MKMGKFDIENSSEIFKKVINSTEKKIHFIGIGGIGMSGLAKILLEAGYRVSGSDIKENYNTGLLKNLGGEIFIGHDAKNVENAGIIVLSSAIKQDNPELIQAENLKIPFVHRLQVLKELIDGLCSKYALKPVSIGASGTHGKTTTSGMLSLVFELAGYDPSFALGGNLPMLKINAKNGKGRHFIAELDESDGTIVLYKLDFTIVSNLEPDHLDHYSGGMEDLLNTFENFADNLNENAKLIVNADCPGNRELISRIGTEKVLLYSTDNPDADYSACKISMSGMQSKFNVYKKSNFIGEIILNVPGLHNISNALSVIAVCLENELPFDLIKNGLREFTGMGRRFQLVGTANGAKIFDDYAHHPTEIIATLKSAKNLIKAGEGDRIAAIFQPHRYSRFAGLWNDFLTCFDDADILYVLDVYSAGETPVENFTAEEFTKKINHPNVKYIKGSIYEANEIICPEIKQGDIVLTIGAGDITRLGAMITEKLDGVKTH